MGYRQPLIVEKFNANTNAEKTIQDRLENIFLSIEASDRKFLLSAIKSAETILMSDGISDEEFLKKNLALRKEWEAELDEKYAEYKEDAKDSLCPDVISKPDSTPDMDHLLDRAVLIISFCQRKGIFLRKKNKLHYGN